MLKFPQPIGASLQAALPEPVKKLLRPLRDASRSWQFHARYGFSPPPEGTDLVGYETLIDFIHNNRLLEIPGDVVEIGAFCGGGTYKLASFISRKSVPKTVYVVDCFNVEFDRTVCTTGASMADLYSRHLAGKSQLDVFNGVTRGLSNVVAVMGDSMRVELPARDVCFGFVDGNHSPHYVRNDFALIWEKLSPGGVIAFHDYGHDLPGVTRALDGLCAEHRGAISDVQTDTQKHILFIQKRIG